MLNLERPPDRQVQVFGKNNLLTPHTYEIYFSQKWPKLFKFLEILNFNRSRKEIENAGIGFIASRRLRPNFR